MRLASYVTKGRPSFGAVSTTGVVDLVSRLGGRYPSLRALLAGGNAALAEARDVARGASDDVPLQGLYFLPVIPDPEKILCVGVNYDEHRKETGRDPSMFPVIFTRFANTQVGHEQPLVRPRVSHELDFEGELAVVIGKRGRHITEADALAHVAGYACYNDASVRDWQRHTHQFTPGKNFVGTGGLGPWLVTNDELPDPSHLTLCTRLNGEMVQRATTDQMIFGIATLLAYISTFTELVPGDIIATGTPGGVGSKRTPPLFMKAGDVVEVELSGIGVLRNPIVDEAS